eukprot:365168-Chlamydomonas_euryale.AAC.5
MSPHSSLSVIWLGSSVKEQIRDILCLLANGSCVIAHTLQVSLHQAWGAMECCWALSASANVSSLIVRTHVCAAKARAHLECSGMPARNVLGKVENVMPPDDVKCFNRPNKPAFHTTCEILHARTLYSRPLSARTSHAWQAMKKVWALVELSCNAMRHIVRQHTMLRYCHVQKECAGVFSKSITPANTDQSPPLKTPARRGYATPRKGGKTENGRQTK